ncbi:MAG: CBS domain-containing protein [Firmicutes bacterium]|nr:CBS domain-containing protein [Bacillota bacterium]
MKVAFFLIPKKDVVWLPCHATMRQALEKMEYHHYTAIPLLDGEGRYVGTITEGDLLRKMKNDPGLDFSATGKVRLTEVPRRVQNTPVRIDAEMEDLIPLVIGQNFVPVVDDEGIFIGIVRRRELIEYLAGLAGLTRSARDRERAFISSDEIPD